MEKAMKDLRYPPNSKKVVQFILLLAILLFNFSSGGTVAVFAAPSNDNFPGTTISVNPYKDTVDTTTATEEPNDPLVPVQCNGRFLAKGRKTVWYTYTPGVNQPLTVDTLGSNYDTYIAIWTGTALNNLTYVACNDDIDVNLQSKLTFTAQAGIAYHIEVAGYGGTVGNEQPNPGGNLVFNLGLVRADTTGVFRPSNGLLYLKNANTTGFADVAINYGLGGDYPVVGDWDGNGTATIGVYRNGQFLLRNSNTLGFADLVFAFGTPGDQPVAGDWNGDGIDTIGIYRPSTGQFLLRNSNTSGLPSVSFFLGNPGDVGIAGDWNGDGIDTTGVFRPSNGVIFLKNANSSGFADVALNYGLAGDRPVTGDWNGDGIDTIGVYRNAQFLLRNSNTNGFANLVFALGNPGDMPIAGDWDGLP
jgi:hypothetical protein